MLPEVRVSLFPSFALVLCLSSLGVEGLLTNEDGHKFPAAQARCIFLAVIITGLFMCSAVVESNPGPRAK